MHVLASFRRDDPSFSSAGRALYGGRFSGAGFKGACIALVDPAKKESIEQAITEKYLAQFPQYRSSFQVCFSKSDDGARYL